MSAKINNPYTGQQVPARALNRPREPLRKFTELAEEFGIDTQRLRSVMGTYARCGGEIPKPALRPPGSRSPGVTYYKPSEMRRFWRNHLESEKLRSE